MITSIAIENYALIEKLNIDFSNKFSVITGETGAGKSILLGALGLLQGKRADLSSLKNTTEKCIIEGSFSISNYHLESFFEQNDLDYEAQTIIRREILPSGKSRAFVNDTPVNLQQLQDLSNYLIDIHSQHQNQELSNEYFQVKILDLIANNSHSVLEYQKELIQYKKLKNQLDELLNSKATLQKESDFNLFLLEEINALNLKIDEQSDLENELSKLNNVDHIKENLERFWAISQEEEIGIISQLKALKQSMQKIASISPEFQLIHDRTESVLIEFQDLTLEVNHENNKLLGDPKRLDELNSRLQAIYALQKKHQVMDVESLLHIQKELSEKVFFANDIENQLLKVEENISKTKEIVDSWAEKIRANRLKFAPILENDLKKILFELGMPNAQFKFELKPVAKYLENGKDEIQLLFSANKGSHFGLLKKTASGGEMSRIMLAVKSILAQKNKLPTLILDEIDTGISGEVANKMGIIMAEMSNDMQVFAITHLPQIASKGVMHYKVYKRNVENSTVSEIKLLNPEERILEIAEMISGKNISDSALNHAKSLLN